MSVKKKVISSYAGSKTPPHVDLHSETILVYRKEGRAIVTDHMTETFTRAVREAVKNQRASKLPVAKYDSKAGRAYLEYADGGKKYIETP